MRTRLKFIDPGFLVAALLPLIGILPTIGNGVTPSADAVLHIHRISAMTTMLTDGHLWPRWVPWFHLGYGYPIFNLYASGTTYVGGILGVLGISATTAFLAISALAWIVGSIGTYRLAHVFLPGRAAILAAMLWAYAPSRLFEVWDQGSMPQMMGGALIPWALLGVWLVTQNPNRRNVLMLALPMAGVILSHQPMTVVTAFFAGPLILILAYWQNRKHPGTFLKRMRYAVAGLILAAGLTAIFLLPAVLELQYVQAREGQDDTFAFLVSKFLSSGDLFRQPPIIDLTDVRYELPETLGPMAGIFSVIGLIALVRRRSYATAALLAAGIIFMLFILTDASITMWEHTPLIAQLRWPGRFLRAGAVVFSLAGGASLLLVPRKWQPVGLSVGMALVLLSTMPLIYPAQEFILVEANHPLDEILWEEDERVWGTTSYDEFDPIWGERIPLARVADDALYQRDPYQIVVRPTDILSQSPDLQAEQIDTSTIQVHVTDARPVRFHQYYFPGWEATLNGEPVKAYGEDQFGLLTVNVPAGEHIITLNYVGTTIQKVGTVISLLSLAIVGYLFFSTHDTIRQATTQRPLESRWALVIAGAVVIFALVNILYIEPQTLLFRQQSPPDAPSGMQHAVNVSFSDEQDELILLGYTLEQASAEPGADFKVTLFWKSSDLIVGRYRSRAQLVNLSVSEAWAVSEPPVPGGGNTNGLTAERFFSDPHEMRVFENAKPYVGRIFVQMVEKIDETPLLLPDGSDHLLLDTLIPVNGAGEAANSTLNYQFGDGITLQCASITERDDELRIELHWDVSNQPEHDLFTFIHALDSDGNTVTQFDGPPLNGDYPTSMWRAGQELADSYTLTANASVEAIGLGLYEPISLDRTTVTNDNNPVQDNRIILPLAEQPCTP